MASGVVLVTGGAGFIGSHVVDALLARGCSVRVLDALAPAVHPDGPSGLDPRAELVRADLRDPEAVRRALTGVDAVSHQAAKVGLGADLGDLPDYVAHNDAGTAALLATLAERRFRGRFVLAGSMVVYGEGGYECPEHGSVRPEARDPADLAAGRFEPACPRCGRPLAPVPVSEEAPTDPRNVYASTKLHQEHLAAAWARETGACLTVLRYHNVYGPRMPRDTPYAGVASIFRSAVEAGRAPQVFEDGKQLRDFVHVADVARANVLALLADPGVAGTFNVASGVPRAVGHLATALAAAAVAPRPVITGRFRLGDVRHVFAATDLARTELGFSAEVPFEEGVREFAGAPLR